MGDDMTNAGNNMTQADFERLLEVYGSDRTRWPVEARTGASHLVARDAAARRLLAEAEALDRVLERAPLPSLAREAALADRIAAAAQRSPRMVPISDGAPAGGAAGAARAAGTVIRWPGLRSRQRWLGASGIGGVAGLLAASLAFGIYIGVSNVMQGALPALAEMTGISLPSGGTTTLAQIDALDEDLL